MRCRLNQRQKRSIRPRSSRHRTSWLPRGANWNLGGLDLTGDGIDDPIGNVLAFHAVRDADGRVAGQIEY
ncbi:MAG TPA: hypothetical protein VK939_18240 [Longimicrobiales bacterium]|nr:hypothetical protein [Longimicrobiales bacterium]